MPTDTPTKPSSRNRPRTGPEHDAEIAEGRSSVEAAQATVRAGRAQIEASWDVLKKSEATLQAVKGHRLSKLGAEKLTPEEQRHRFIEAAREAGASEDEAEFDANLKRIAKKPRADS